VPDSGLCIYDRVDECRDDNVTLGLGEFVDFELGEIVVDWLDDGVSNKLSTLENPAGFSATSRGNMPVKSIAIR